MSPSRVPADTPITNQSPHARVVCCTVSGRNGPMLENEKFNVLLVDEAAQCMEAWFWSLLRPEVHTVVMVGDTQQLPALASETGVERGYNRSLMERLVSSGYPVKFLNVQHRMHPEIVLYPNTEFYGGALQTEYASSDKPSSSLAPYKIIAVDGKCVETGTRLCQRSGGVRLRRDAARNTKSENVVIVTPYQGQTRALLAASATKRSHRGFLSRTRGRRRDSEHGQLRGDWILVRHATLECLFDAGASRTSRRGGSCAMDGCSEITGRRRNKTETALNA